MGAILPVEQHGEHLLSGMAQKARDDRLGSQSAKPAGYPASDFDHSEIGSGARAGDGVQIQLHGRKKNSSIFIGPFGAQATLREKVGSKPLISKSPKSRETVHAVSS